MEQLLGGIPEKLINPGTLLGALVYGAVFAALATLVAAVIRRAARRIESRLSDVTGLRFVGAFAQLLTYLIAIILYAHLVPELRALGTALLAGVSVVSLVVGLAAQSTLGNLIAGVELQRAMVMPTGSCSDPNSLYCRSRVTVSVTTRSNMTHV